MPPKKDRSPDPENQTGSSQNSNAKPVSRIRNLRILVPLIFVITLIVFLFWLYLFNRRNFVSTDDAYIDADRVSVSAKLLGRVSQLMVDEGDSVQAGQLIVKLDDSDLLAQEAQARASLKLAQENIILAKINMKRVKKDYERARLQLGDGAISREKFDHTQSDYEAAEARISISMAQAQTAEAQVGVIETQLDNTELSSPMDGVVSKRWVIAGDIVSPGQAIFSIYNLKDVWITANLEETRLSELREGNKVSIKVDSYPRREFTGKILRIGTNTAAQFSLFPPNNASGNFTKITQRVPIKISIDQTAGHTPVRLLPGMSVNVKIRVR